MSPLISVIVPIYNVEPYLRECLDSIIRQSYTNLEIILINDGSTDKSGAIAGEYALLDSRVKVIHQANAGVSVARNTGLGVAGGEYLSFVDSDDWLEPEMYEELVPILEGRPHLSLVKFGVIKKEKHERYRGDRALQEYEGLRGYLYSKAGGILWNALYRREALKGIRFVPGYICEDIYFTHRLFAQEGIRFALYNRRLYHYRTSRPGSIMAGDKLRLMEDQGHLWELLLSEVGDSQKAYLNLAHLMYLKTMELFLLRDLSQTPEHDRQAFAVPFVRLIKKARANSQGYPVPTDWRFFWLMIYIKAPRLFWVCKHPSLYFKFKDYLVRK